MTDVAAPSAARQYDVPAAHKKAKDPVDTMRQMLDEARKAAQKAPDRNGKSLQAAYDALGKVVEYAKLPRHFIDLLAKTVVAASKAGQYSDRRMLLADAMLAETLKADVKSLIDAAEQEQRLLKVKIVKIGASSNGYFQRAVERRDTLQKCWSLAEAKRRTLSAIWAGAKRRIDDRDAAGWKADCKDLPDLDAVTMALGTVAALEKQMQTLEKKTPGLAVEFASGLVSEGDKLRQEVDVVITAFDKLLGDIRSVQIPAIDAAKALKLIAFDAKHLKALDKALNGPAEDRASALDAVAKQAKVAMPGKTLLDQLKRAGIV